MDGSSTRTPDPEASDGRLELRKGTSTTQPRPLPRLPFTHITSALLQGPLTASWATPPAATHRCASNDHHHPVEASWATPPAATSQTTMTLPKTAQHPPPRKRLQQLDPRPDGGPHTRQPPRDSRLHHHPTTYRLSQTTPTRTHRHQSPHITQLSTDLTTTTHVGQHGHIPSSHTMMI